MAGQDLKAALGLLDARHVAGDPELSARLLSATRAQWRAQAAQRVPELRAAVEERAAEHGEVAYLLEPDLKSARGGLRDVHALQALAAAQVADPPGPAVQSALSLLLDVRGELHRRTAGAGRRVVDRLLLQEQDAVAAALSYVDADALMVAVSDAARTVAYAGDTTWRRLRPAPKRRLLGRRRVEPVRRPLGDDVVEQDGEAVLARDADPAQDAVLPLRVAAAAARAGVPVAPSTLSRLAAECPALPVPWPRPALDAFVSLLAAGPSAVPVLESLDRAGLLVRLLPEWALVRSKPQRNSYHRFTVDRHLVEAAAAAAGLTRRVARPDLLLLGALLHDIGKGVPGDHTQTGMVLVAELAPRLGLPREDVAVLVSLVEHHLLLPDVATRRDLSDPATARAVADAVGSAEVLELLHALTEADAAATGPAAWSTWKAGLVGDLVRRTAALLAGTPPPAPVPLADWQTELVDRPGDRARRPRRRGHRRRRRPPRPAVPVGGGARAAPARRPLGVGVLGRAARRRGVPGGAALRRAAGLGRRARRPAARRRRVAAAGRAARVARGGVRPERTGRPARGAAGRRRVGVRDGGRGAGRRRPGRAAPHHRRARGVRAGRAHGARVHARRRRRRRLLRAAADRGGAAPAGPGRGPRRAASRG